MNVTKPLTLICFFFTICLAAQSKDSLYVQKLLDSAYAFERTAPDKAIAIYKESLAISNEINYDKGVFRSLLYTGIVLSDNGKYDDAIATYEEAIPFSKKIKYLKGEAATLINISNAYQYKEDYFQAIQNYLEGIKVYEKLKDSVNLGISYTNLAAIFDNINNLKDEEIYLKKALRVSKSNPVSYGVILCDLASHSLKKNNRTLAYKYLQQADSIQKIKSDHWLDFQVSRIFADYYTSINDYNRSIVYNKQSLDNVNKLNNVFFKAEIMANLGLNYLKLSNKSKAKFYLEQAEELNNQLNSKRNQKFVYAYLSEYYQYVNPKLALTYLNKSNKIKDSINLLDNLKKVTYLENEFEISKKDKEIVQKQLEIANKEQEILNNQRKIVWGVVVLVILTIILVLFYFINKQRQKLKDNQITILKQKGKQLELEKLIEAEEKERTRIAQDLHDGVNGDLSAIKYHLSNINQENLTEILKVDINKSIGMIDESCNQIRSISHNLSPYAIENYGLIDAVEQYCVKLSDANKLDIEFQQHGLIINLPKFIETTIYRIIQELLINVVKHAKSKEVLVQINYQESFMLLTIEDDGIGFDVATTKEGIGLQNIKSRVQLLEANMNIDSSASGSNFEIEIDISNYV